MDETLKKYKITSAEKKLNICFWVTIFQTVEENKLLKKKDKNLWSYLMIMDLCVELFKSYAIIMLVIRALWHRDWIFESDFYILQLQIYWMIIVLICLKSTVGFEHNTAFKKIFQIEKKRKPCLIFKYFYWKIQYFVNHWLLQDIIQSFGDQDKYRCRKTIMFKTE